MKKIRIGNDFVFNWAIERGGFPEDLLSVLEKHLHLSVFGKRVELIEGVDYDITGNVIRIEVTPTIANIIGTYKAEFHYILPDNGLIDEDRKCAVDVDAFQIVARTAQADDPSEFTVTSDMAIAFKGDKGDSAYQVWLDAGNTGTEEDYFAYLRQPAVDAGASISELEGAIQVSEGLRVSAESERDLAEGTRVQSENERLAAEIIRQSNEGNRIENEATRVQNEAERISEEGIRQSNEIDRVEAEGVRVQAESERVQAEIERQATIQEAVTATNLANEKANLANAAAQSANEAAGLADTARTELTTAVNTKLGEADAKIEEMDTTLSTYDGRVTQVESDITQLAGEVSLLDAVQGAKIKDIENVISTMNLNQSAQLSVSGVSPLSLPKNAANGGMSVKMEGLTAENLVTGGKLIIATSYAYSPGIKIDVINGNKYYGKRLYQTISGTDGAATGRIATLNPAHEFVRASDSSIVTTYSEATEIQKNLYMYGPQVGTDTIGEFSDVMIINLTATFGAGNEPTKEQCDLIFSDYFEGVKSFEPTGRVRSVGKNLFDFGYWKNYSNFPTIAGGGYRSRSWQLKPNTTYTFRVTLKGSEKPTNYFQVSGGDGVRWSISSPVFSYPSVRSFTTGSDGILMLYTSGGQSGLTSLFETTNFMVVEGGIEAPYEPYRETSLYLTAPELRSNGTVKDEIRKGSNGYELVKRISEVDGTVLANPVITPISYGGILNSAENGTVYHEPIIADAGVYGTNLPILMTDYPIATIEEIIKHENGIDTYLNVDTAVIASDGLSFTHPDLVDGDLVLFTYAFDKESTNGNITATFYDSNVVKIDTVTGKAYKIEDVATNGVLTRTLTEV